jgi:hypothetical protein
MYCFPPVAPPQDLWSQFLADFVLQVAAAASFHFFLPAVLVFACQPSCLTTGLHVACHVPASRACAACQTIAVFKKTRPAAAQPSRLTRPALLPSLCLSQVVRRPVVVAGNSIGGFISASLAADYPGAVQGLVLLNSAGAPPRLPPCSFCLVFFLFSFVLSFRDAKGIQQKHERVSAHQPALCSPGPGQSSVGAAF